ncbi:MAG TPA: hypothetical protein VKB90_02685 [Candidatus Acidoferrum sp.]|nr:hypothetical protein [Candidatus Acidoferrum sp.]
MSTGPALVPSSDDSTSSVLIAIKINFTLNTPDGLRRVIFGLEKDTQADAVVWKINFQLFERDHKTDDFGDAIVTLDVEVDIALHANAEAAAQNGLTPPQSAHALGPASDDAKAAQAGQMDTGDAKQTVQNTLTASDSQ